ncbi:hypothetical protein GCM10010517_01240 [Streptosporangium fragile]|uniref:Uncharacterized protein n=1 Tax=Streptosporangium fragile TaxID=46186 RepID=A0ABP6I5N5_9ACTN
MISFAKVAEYQRRGAVRFHAVIRLDGEELRISHQLSRVRGRLLHRERTKTENSTDSLPLLGLCVSALRGRR